MKKTRRRGVTKAAIKAHGVELVLITNGSDVRYLTRCTEDASGMLCGPGWSIIFTSKMLEKAIPDQAPGVRRKKSLLLTS